MKYNEITFGKSIDLTDKVIFMDNIEKLVYIPISFNAPIPTIGIDPGTRNLGIALLHPQNSFALRVKICRDNYVTQRILNIGKIFVILQQLFPSLLDVKCLLLEGASFGKIYRQVELAEQRTAILLWFLRRKFGETEIYQEPPNTIRKYAFGNGKIKRPPEWENIQSDVAAAVGCALYGILKYQQEHYETR